MSWPAHTHTPIHTLQTTVCVCVCEIERERERKQWPRRACCNNTRQRNSQTANRKNAIFPFCVTFVALLSCVCFLHCSHFCPFHNYLAHTITIQGSRCEEEEEKPFQNRTRALTRPLSLSLSLTTVNFCHCGRHCHLHSHHINSQTHTHTHM